MQMAHTDTGEDWAEAVAAMRGAVQKPCNDFGLLGARKSKRSQKTATHLGSHRGNYGYQVNDAYAVHDQMLWLPIGLAYAQ